MNFMLPFLKNNKIAALVWRETIKNAALITFAVLAVLSFILVKNKTEWYFHLPLLFSGICAVWAAHYRLRIVFLVLLGIITCFERHLIIHYSSVFSAIGSQVLITLQITDPDEITAYFKLFRPIEYVLPLLFAAGCAVEFWQKRPPLSQGIPALDRKEVRCAVLVLSLTGLLWSISIEFAPPFVEYIRTWKKEKNFYQQRAAFRFNARSQDRKPVTTVLIIGESHRKDALDRFVFGPDSHAPFLKKVSQQGLVWHFDNMITPYQQTFFSVFTLLTRRGNDGHNLLWPENGLFGLFNEAGYQTVFLTYQNTSPKLTGYNFAVNEANVYINHRNFSGTKFDHGMLRPLKEIMERKKYLPEKEMNAAAEKKNLFIIAKMVGVHFHYTSRYPKSYALYKPCYSEKLKRSEYSLKDKVLLDNTYFNAMAYSADFLDKAARQIDEHPEPAVMIFVSDHGIINFDDKENVFFGAAKSNFHIPCFIYGNAPYRAQLSAEMIKNMKKNRALSVTNSYLFDTVATLSNVTYPGKRAEMDLTSDRVQPVSPRDVWVVKTKRKFEELP